MAKVLSVLEKNILKAKGLSDADLKKMASVGVRSMEDFQTVGDPGTFSELLGVSDTVARKVMTWALAQIAVHAAAGVAPVLALPGPGPTQPAPAPASATVVPSTSGAGANGASSHPGVLVSPAAPAPFVTNGGPANGLGVNGGGSNGAPGNGGVANGAVATVSSPSATPAAVLAAAPESSDAVLCIQCRAKQPREYKSGDSCVACGRQPEPILTCFWCSSSGSGKFCRRCGAEFVPTGELELALLLKREGIPKQDISLKLKSLSPEEKEQLWGRVRRYQG